MTDFATTPLTFTGAERWLEQKVNLPTGLNSREISNRAPARIRMASFFSAGVASAHILENLRAEVEKIRSGQTDYVSARARLKDFLGRQGYVIPGAGTAEARDMGTLPSTARLNLILRQNVAMAHAIGQREVSENAAVKELYPNYKYHAVMDENTRDTHAELDGLVLPKDDPFWNTHYPPWEFNCRCIVTDTDEPANGKTAGIRTQPDGSETGKLDFNGRATELMPNESGFVFESDPAKAFQDPDFSIIHDEDLRTQFEAEWKKRFGPAS